MAPPPIIKAAIAVKGLLLPATWDEIGRITGLLLAAFDEKEYYIADFEDISHWQGYLSTQVSVHGMAYQLCAQTWISVRSMDPIGANQPVEPIGAA
jgi:hypothetical protein